MRTRSGISILLLLAALALTGQDSSPSNNSNETGILQEAPKGFRDLQLGLDINTIKERLILDPYFNYRGDPDVSLLQQPNQALIECSGNSYIRRSYFQFYRQKLFSIILDLDQQKLDYFTVYTSLTEQYGKPTSLDPSEAVWVFKTVRLSLEKPLNIKYLDRVVFEALKLKGAETEDLRQLSKEEFLEQL